MFDYLVDYSIKYYTTTADRVQFLWGDKEAIPFTAKFDLILRINQLA